MSRPSSTNLSTGYSKRNYRQSLKIGIDISTFLDHGPEVGAGRYILNLVNSLLSSESGDTFILTGRYTTGKHYDIIRDLEKKYGRDRVSVKVFRISPRILKVWDRMDWPPLECLGFKADLLHCPDYLIPPTLNKNIVLTVHDLAFIRHPEFNFEWFISKYSALVRKNTVRARTVFADSVSTRDDIIKFLETDPARVEVIYPAADSFFRKLDESEIDKKVPEKYNTGQRFILSVGTIEPRKNYVALVRAFNTLKKTGRYPGVRLVIAGQTGWKSEDSFREINESPFKGDIIVTGKITDGDLLQLYNQAELFAYPSFLEGFGLPPLEAMQCGLPVICSDSSSLREVVGNAGIMVPPNEYSILSGNIAKMLDSGQLRGEYSGKGLKKARTFSWEKTAQRAIKIYHKIADKKQ
ncbi:MAG: glycosyltransferase family 4 protein [Actinobacteria bacterium]|nr:glycosyltransferase family 4 protein [Actinomycetota bacterium]